MKVLLFTSRIPIPAKSGYPIVVYNTITGLVEAGAEVTVFSLNPESNGNHVPDDPILEKINLVIAPVKTDIRIWDSFVNLFKRRSNRIFRFFQLPVVARLKNVLQHTNFDIVQLEGLVTMPYIDLIRQNSNAKIIYRAHNIEHQFSKGLAASERSFVKRLFLKFLARRLFRFETENLNKPDAIITINSADQSHLKYLGCTKTIENFPVAVDPENYKADLSSMDYPSIFHIGAMDMLLNLESVDWFLKNVWGDLGVLNSRLKFHIAGKNIPKEFYNHQDDDILLHDEIDDAREFMNSKAVMIVPLRSGSGMRVKIIEGMAMKKCIISTSLGAQGINYQHGKNILIADSPDEFYKYILQSTTDRQFCESIGENARKLVEKEYNIKHQHPKLLSFYQDLITA